MLLCLCILLAACKKTTVTPTNNAAIKGTWELRATRYGNILPATYPQDNGHVLSFGNTAFAQYFVDVLVDSGSYAKSTNSIYQYTVFASDNTGSFTNNIILKGDTLELIPGDPDAARGFYVRTGNNPLH